MGWEQRNLSRSSQLGTYVSPAPDISPHTLEKWILASTIHPHMSPLLIKARDLKRAT